jgi:hypothetical protein
MSSCGLLGAQHWDFTFQKITEYIDQLNEQLSESLFYAEEFFSDGYRNK